MQIHRVLLSVVVVVTAACSGPGDTQVGERRTTSEEQNEALIRQVLELINDRLDLMEQIGQPEQAIADFDSSSIRNNKKELLQTELSQREAGILTRENRLIQSKILLATVIIAILGFMPGKLTRLDSKARSVMMISCVIIFFFYWHDNYTVDLQKRSGDRIHLIYHQLDRFPTMKTADIDTIKVFPDLSKSDPSGKIGLIFRPKFEQLITYGPFLLILIGFTFYSIIQQKRIHGNKDPNMQEEITGSSPAQKGDAPPAPEVDDQ